MHLISLFVMAPEEGGGEAFSAGAFAGGGAWPLGMASCRFPEGGGEMLGDFVAVHGVAGDFWAGGGVGD